MESLVYWCKKILEWLSTKFKWLKNYFFSSQVYSILSSFIVFFKVWVSNYVNILSESHFFIKISFYFNFACEYIDNKLNLLSEYIDNKLNLLTDLLVNNPVSLELRAIFNSVFNIIFSIFYEVYTSKPVFLLRILYFRFKEWLYDFPIIKFIVDKLSRFSIDDNINSVEAILKRMETSVENEDYSFIKDRDKKSIDQIKEEADECIKYLKSYLEYLKKIKEVETNKIEYIKKQKEEELEKFKNLNSLEETQDLKSYSELKEPLNSEINNYNALLNILKNFLNENLNSLNNKKYEHSFINSKLDLCNINILRVKFIKDFNEKKKSLFYNFYEDKFLTKLYMNGEDKNKIFTFSFDDKFFTSKDLKNSFKQKYIKKVEMKKEIKEEKPCDPEDLNDLMSHRCIKQEAIDNYWTFGDKEWAEAKADLIAEAKYRKANNLPYDEKDLIDHDNVVNTEDTNQEVATENNIIQEEDDKLNFTSSYSVTTNLTDFLKQSYPDFIKDPVKYLLENETPNIPAPSKFELHLLDDESKEESCNTVLDLKSPESNNILTKGYDDQKPWIIPAPCSEEQIVLPIEKRIFNAYWGAIDYVYITSQKLWAYDLIAKSYNLASWLHDNNYSLTFEIFFRAMSVIVAYELFLSSILDSVLNNTIVQRAFSENMLRWYLGSLDSTMFLIYHPEAAYSYTPVSDGSANTYMGQWYIFIDDLFTKYSLATPIQYLLQLLLVFFFALVFLTFFFSFFSKNKEEWQDDVNYSISNLSAESEKELGAFDDLIYLVGCALFIFIMYFGFFASLIDINITETSFYLSFWPLFVLVIMFIPVNLLFDFGLFFLLYLRGSSKTSSLAFECVYDWMGIIAFFTRIFVQFVRQILILVVYLMMHDTVVLQVVPSDIFFLNDSFWSEISNVQPTFDSISYFLTTKLPLRILYWVYEVLHTFFVATGQFAAFFTIVFWLFLLLYTSFFYLKYEHYFDNLDKLEQDIINELKSLK